MEPIGVVWTVLGIALAILIVYDVYRVVRYGRTGTISHAFYVRGKYRPFFAFSVGFACGGFVFGLAMHFWGV